MMYSKKFAVALKSADGRVLREFDGDKVYVPFGSEYSVFLKNMHGVRAIAQISIDGKDVGGGMTFVVPAYGQMEIERSVKNGNLHEGNRFKFIERTSKVAAHRGVDAEDGLVRVTFQLEKPQPIIRTYYHDTWGGTDSGYRGMTHDSFDISDSTRSRSGKSFGNSNATFSTANATTKGLIGDGAFQASDDVAYAAPQNEVGVTAPGSLSEQEFSISDNFPVEAEKTVFVLQIFGETEDNRHVREPVTVKTKPRCSQCGTFNRFDAKFCSECGAGLQIV